MLPCLLHSWLHFGAGYSPYYRLWCCQPLSFPGHTPSVPLHRQCRGVAVSILVLIKVAMLKKKQTLKISVLGYGYPKSMRVWRRESCGYTVGRTEPISAFLFSFCTSNVAAFFSASIWAPAAHPWEWVWMLWTHCVALDNVGAVSLAAVTCSEALKWKSQRRRTKWYMCLRDLQFPWQGWGSSVHF